MRHNYIKEIIIDFTFLTINLNITAYTYTLVIDIQAVINKANKIMALIYKYTDFISGIEN